MQIRAKSTIKTILNLQGLVCVLALMIVLAHSQSDCSAKTFPDIIPMRPNETLSINLHEYFEGNNMSFSVLPSSTKSYIDQAFECKDLKYHNLGKVLSSQYYKRNESQVLAILTQSVSQPLVYAFHYIQVDRLSLTTFNITLTQISNCNAFLLSFINQTHFQITVNCKSTKKQRNVSYLALVSTIVRLSTYKPQWTVTLTPLFTSTNILGVQLQLNKDVLFRGIFSSYNSYIQVWNWDDDQRFVIGVIDKTYLKLDIFNLKQMRHYGNNLVLLDFIHGLYVIRFGKSKIYQKSLHFQQSFYSGFEFNQVTGQLLLYKKGKIDTIIIENIQNGDLLVGKSYNIQQYQTISKIIMAQNKIVALTSNYIHLFIQTGENYFLNYNLYSIQYTVNLFARTLGNQPLTLLRLYNNKQVISYSSCTVKTPFLHIAVPSQPQLITVTGESKINSDSTFCRQSFRVQKLEQQRALIYDNGYQADNQVIFANLPGKSQLILSRYGIAKNLSYQVLQSPTSKIQYESRVNKLEYINCQITSKPIPFGGMIYFTTTWQQLLITQTTNDNSLKYFVCSQGGKLNCVPTYQETGFQPISNFAYEMIERTEEYSVSYQALVQQSKGDINILVRKLLIIEPNKQIAISSYCTIKLTKRAEEYSNITQMEIVNGKLFVLLRYRKQIRIYTLSDATCTSISNLTVLSFPGEYFSPNRFYLNSLDSNRHQIIRVRQWNELLTIRLRGSNLSSPVIISRTSLPEIANGSVVLSQPYLIYLSLDNNKVYCYQFNDSSQLQFLHELDLEGMKLVQINKGQENYYKLLDSTHIAIYLIDSATKAIVVKVFAFTELISSASDYLYATLDKDEQMIVFLKGQQPSSRYLIRLQLLNGPAVSYLFCKSNKLNLAPSITFNFHRAFYPVQNYFQNVTVILQTAEDLHAHHFRISLSNIGSGISKGSRFPGRGTTISASTELTIDDSFWFSGSIYNFTVDCKDCNNRISFTQKASLEKHWPLPFSSNVFLEQKDKIISFLDEQFIIRLQENYSPWPFDSTKDGYQLKQIHAVGLDAKQCIDSKFSSRAIISLCYRLTVNDDKEYYLSLTSIVSFKGFILDQITMGFQINATPKLLLLDNIIIVYTAKVAVIFTIWDVQQSTRFVQLDRIDSQDISQTICTLQLTSNSTSPNTDITKLMYTVVLTQCDSQIFYSPFSIYIQEERIVDQAGRVTFLRFPNIHATPQIINLMKVWTQRHIQIPSDAKIIQTITRKEPSSFEQEEVLSLILVFDKFHSYRFRIILSKISKITKGITLEEAYYKFGSNVALSAQLTGYLVIKYLEETDTTFRQVFACFDPDYYTENPERIKQHYSFAAYTLPYSDKSLQVPRSNWYLTTNNDIFYVNNDTIQIVKVKNKLIGRISGLQPNQLLDPELPLYTQKIVIYSHNPVDSKSATLQLNAVDIVQLSGLQIALIVIGSLILAITLVVGGRVLVKKVKKRMKMVEIVENQRAQDALLEIEDQEKVGQTYEVNGSLAEGIINQTERGSVQP